MEGIVSLIVTRVVAPSQTCLLCRNISVKERICTFSRKSYPYDRTCSLDRTDRTICATASRDIRSSDRQILRGKWAPNACNARRNEARNEAWNRLETVLAPRGDRRMRFGSDPRSNGFRYFQSAVPRLSVRWARYTISLCPPNHL